MGQSFYNFISTSVNILGVVRNELLLFSIFWIIILAIDELAIDISWIYLRLTGKVKSKALTADEAKARPDGIAAIFVPAWQEAAVIGTTIGHMLRVWPNGSFVIYAGCYRNDPATREAIDRAAGGNPQVQAVVVDADGPTTKADCLNTLYARLCADEVASGTRYAAVILQDAEDMVHPAALCVIDRALKKADFVQLPVRPEVQSRSRWVAGHYLEEFAEAHAKELVVRDALGAAIPAAGVGCGFARDMLEKIAAMRLASGAIGPFAADCLTEDYELGQLVTRLGGTGRFVRLRDPAGGLIATRCYFPDVIQHSVRQKTRWVHGIAFQGWDRLGWSGSWVDKWMVLRDRRGPLTAVVLGAAYVFILIELILAVARMAGFPTPFEGSSQGSVWLGLCLATLLWRAAWRFGFTAREYGWAEGCLAVLRMPLANMIAIGAGCRALIGYIRTLNGAALVWDKTEHHHHPAHAIAEARP